MELNRPINVSWMVSLVVLYTELFYCNIIDSQNGNEEPNVVYPTHEATVVLTPGNIDCSAVTDTRCTTSIPGNDIYTVTLTLTNEIGTTGPVTGTFNCE